MIYVFKLSVSGSHDHCSGNEVHLSAIYVDVSEFICVRWRRTKTEKDNDSDLDNQVFFLLLGAGDGFHLISPRARGILPASSLCLVSVCLSF